MNYSANNIHKGNGVKLSIIDQGVVSTHPDLDFSSTGGLYENDLMNLTFDPKPALYGPHGTACAGIIKATPNNNKGICGIAPDVKLYSYAHPLYPVPNAIQQLANGIEIACSNCDVLSCSWGGEDLRSTMIEDALHYYAHLWGRNGKGTIVVFSAGNDNSNVSFPANCNGKNIVVGSINKNGARSTFSNYGPQIDVVAPGEEIPTTDVLSGIFDYPPYKSYNEGNYYFLKFNGTSSSCPHVSAVAAAMLSANPDLTAKEIEEIMAKTAKKNKHI